jgi:glycosyltransferase involved in cell wall biosynthesis
MTIRPTVSVVIPTYNTQAWVEETLESVFRQTYPHNRMELLVVDDGSVDDTADVARSVMRGRTIRGRVIENAHKRGVSAARNDGWKVARGEWLQFLDADDLLAPNKIELQMEWTSRVPEQVAVVYSNWQGIAQCNGAWQPIGPMHEPFVDDNTVVRILQDPYFGYVGPALIRKSSLAAIGGFDEECSLGEDMDAMLRLAMTGGRFYKAASEAATFFYRQTPDSLWHQGVTSVDTMRRLLAIFTCAETYLRSQSKDGSICEDARKGLAKRYTKWADFYFERDPDSFRDIARRLVALGQTCPPDLSRSMRVLSSVMGWENALRFRSSYRRAAVLLHRLISQALRGLAPFGREGFVRRCGER